MREETREGAPVRVGDVLLVPIERLRVVRRGGSLFLSVAPVALVVRAPEGETRHDLG